MAGVDEVVTVARRTSTSSRTCRRPRSRPSIEQSRPAVVAGRPHVDSLGLRARRSPRGSGTASPATPRAVAWDGRARAPGAAPTATSLTAELEFPGKETVAPAAPGGRLRAGRGRRCAERDPLSPGPADRGRAPSTRLPRGRDRRRRHHEGRLPALDRPRGRGRGAGVPSSRSSPSKMGATLSVSRPLVDAGWVPSARQVGPVGQDRQAEGVPRARASRARSSTSRACRRPTRSSRSTPTRRRRSSQSRTTARSPTCSTSPTSSSSSSR